LHIRYIVRHVHIWRIQRTHKNHIKSFCLLLFTTVWNNLYRTYLDKHCKWVHLLKLTLNKITENINGGICLPWVMTTNVSDKVTNNLLNIKTPMIMTTLMVTYSTDYVIRFNIRMVTWNKSGKMFENWTKLPFSIWFQTTGTARDLNKICSQIMQFLKQIIWQKNILHKNQEILLVKLPITWPVWKSWKLSL
jgi:hypothetical protein